MELGNTGPEMAAVLQEMGVRYNPRRLANALRGRNLEISTRAIRITYTLGKFIIALAQVTCMNFTAFASQEQTVASNYLLQLYFQRCCTVHNRLLCSYIARCGSKLHINGKFFFFPS